MKKFYYQRLKEETDAAYSSDSPVKSEEYNQLYREWRCDEENRFVFAGKRSRKLHTYVDGVGIYEKTAEKQERYALKNMCIILTAVAFIYALAENVFIFPVILLLKGLGMEISYSFHDSSAYGNQYAVLIAFVFEGLIKFLVPLIFVRRMLKMPLKLAYPIKVENKRSAFAAVSILLIGISFLMMIRIYLPYNIFTVNDINMVYKASLGMNIGCKAFLVIFELLVVSVMKELLFHGALFQAMRQFGVSFAVIIIAIIVTVEMHNPVSAAIVFVTVAIAGYGVWQSGSILTGIVVHMIGRSLSFILFWCKDFPNINGIPAEFLFTLIILAMGLIGCLILSVSKNKLLSIKDYETFISMKEKVKFSTLKTSLVIVWILFGILALIEVFI